MAEVNYFDPRDIQIVNESLGTRDRFNPRTLMNPGFSTEKMEDLKRGIALDGLNHALVVRLVQNKPRLVAGERRLRAILGLLEADQAALKRIQSGEKDVQRVYCKNPQTRRMEPALNVYNKVECKISDAQDEKQLLRQAITENTLHEGLTDYELLLQCEKMEKAGFTRLEQAETMGVSEAWISQSHSLLKKHNLVLHYMQAGQLQRTAALTFLRVPDEEVEAVLERAIGLTYKEAEQKERQATQELSRAKDDLQHGEASLRLSQFTGNVESARKARRQVSKAGRAIEVAEKKLRGAKARKEKNITSETITQAAKDVDAADHLIKPQSMKIVRNMMTELSNLLDNEVIEYNGEELDREQVEIVQGVLAWMLDRNYCKHPLDVVKPLVF